MIVETGKKAADAADRNADDQRQRECVATRPLRADHPLDQFHADDTAEQGVDDRLTFEQMAPVQKVSEGVRGSSIQ